MVLPINIYYLEKTIGTTYNVTALQIWETDIFLYRSNFCICIAEVRPEPQKDPGPIVKWLAEQLNKWLISGK